MTRRLIPLLAVGAVLAGASSARADVTLGTTTFPGGGIGGNLAPGHFVVSVFSPPSLSYTVPAGGGAITSWSISTLLGSPGAGFAFFVARGSKILASDPRALPSPPPAGHVATYSPATPVVVEAGDRLGLLRPLDATGTFGGLIGGGATPADQVNAAGTFAGADLLTTSSGAGGQMIFSAAVRQAVNLSASAAAVSPARPVVGQLMLLSGTVRNAGPSAAAMTVTDSVPGGLKVVAAFTGAGACGASGQFVSCPVPGLAPGGSLPVVIVARPSAARTYGNTIAAASVLPDTSPGNDTASTTFTVHAKPVAPKVSCIVPALRGLTLSSAKRLLKLTNCRMGRVTKRRSRTVRKGSVISSSPKAITRHAQNAKVALVVSSGKPPKKKKTTKK